MDLEQGNSKMAEPTDVEAVDGKSTEEQLEIVYITCVI